MFKVEILVHDALNDFLSPKIMKHSSRIVNSKRRSIKDLIESLGIPHTELGKIFVNGRLEKSSFVVQEGCQIEAFPFSPVDALQEERFGINDLKFLCDVHLGTLVRNLRLLGFDVTFNREWTDCELAVRSQEEGRFILTRDRYLLMRKNVERGIFIRSILPDRQVSEILERLDLKSRCRPFSRCLVCNGLLQSLDRKGELFNSLRKQFPEKVQLWCQDYTFCGSCHQVFWKGSHYKKLKKKLNGFLSGH